MMQPEHSYLVTGTLIDQQKILHEIELIISTKRLPGRSGGEDEAISGIKLAHSSPVPDGGPYILRYVFKGRQREDRMHLKLGTLMSA